MCLFFVAFAIQWWDANHTKLRIGAGVFMFVVATLVVWCLWTARDRCNSKDKDEGDDEAPLGLDLLRMVKTLFIRRPSVVESLPGEAYPLQSIASRHDAPNVIPGPNLGANFDEVV